MSTSPSEMPNEDSGNPFINLRELLNLGNLLDASLDEVETNPYITLMKRLNLENVSVATLATAIEDCGIYTWDKYGRFKKFIKDTPEAQRALELLQYVYKYEIDSTPSKADKQHPLDASNDWDDPYWLYGWALKVLPDFKAIQTDQLEVIRMIKVGSTREESSNLRIIAVLLRIIKGEMTGMKKHPDYTDEAPMILDMEAEFSNKNEGLSKRNLEKRFAEAKQALK